MKKVLSLSCLVLCFSLAQFSDPPCLIELECRECIPDNMPLVTSHRAANGTVTVPADDELRIACHGGRFLAYPTRDSLDAVCEAGRFRVRYDGKVRHLLELGCQENIFEDVQHQVEFCGNPYQGRAYRMHDNARSIRHLATVCFDEDRAIAISVHASNAPRNQLIMAEHNEQSAPLSLLGNFNHMFDANTRHQAEELYSDDIRLNRRLHELFKHEKFTFADQTLTSGKLLGTHYFDDQNTRVTDFVSNKVAVWKSIVNGNLGNLHHDVAKFMRLTRPHATLDIYSGTHGVLALRSGHSRTPIYLKAGNRFPVPRYLWTVIHDKPNQKAIALILLNDPFVSVSEIRESVFCDSICSNVPWLHELRRNRNYETPVNGLVFCCDVHTFANNVQEMPKDVIRNVPLGNPGVLNEMYNY